MALPVGSQEGEFVRSFSTTVNLFLEGKGSVRLPEEANVCGSSHFASPPACQVLQQKGEVSYPGSPWAGGTESGSINLSMEFSYSCLASSSWDDLQRGLEKHALPLH